MRVAKDAGRTSNQPHQCPLFEKDNYSYRISCTSLDGTTHGIIADYDKRADA
jgi:hypothetical protein